MKTIQLLCLLGLIFFQTHCAFAQKNDYEDVVYLKNGSIIRGLVMEQIPNGNVKIETKDGSIFVYPMAEVEKITKEKRKGEGKSTKKEDNTVTSNKGFNLGVIVESAFCLGLQGKYARNNDMINGQIVINTMLTPQFSLGGAIGWDRYYDAFLNRSFIPLMVDIRYYPLKGKVSPSLVLDAGYCAGFGGGAIVNPAIGLKANLSKRWAFHTNFGYRFQQFSQAQVNGYGAFFSGDLTFISMRGGFSYMFLDKRK